MFIHCFKLSLQMSLLYKCITLVFLELCCFGIKLFRTDFMDEFLLFLSKAIPKDKARAFMIFPETVTASDKSLISKKLSDNILNVWFRVYQLKVVLLKVYLQMRFCLSDIKDWFPDAWKLCLWGRNDNGFIIIDEWLFSKSITTSEFIDRSSRATGSQYRTLSTSENFNENGNAIGITDTIRSFWMTYCGIKNKRWKKLFHYLSA